MLRPNINECKEQTSMLKTIINECQEKSLINAENKKWKLRKIINAENKHNAKNSSYWMLRTIIIKWWEQS